MSTIAGPRRHALGMPAGSVRALLGLNVLGLLWLLALKDPNKLPPVFIYLTFIKLVILTHYFSAHSRTMGKQVSSRHALGLPRGTVRLALLGGFIGLLAFLWKHSPQIELPPNSDQLFAVIGLLLLG